MFRLYGFDFRDYARTSLRRRIAQHHAARRRCATISALQERVLHDRGCWSGSCSGISVNVSAMFRDPAFFLAFRQHAVPLLRTYPFIRIWQAGCSIGEEVYSLAILLEEEGLYDRCADLRDRHQRGDAAPGARRHLSRRADAEVHAELHPGRRHSGRSRSTTPRATTSRSCARRCSGTSCSRSTTSSSDGAVQRVQRDPVPQRDDLLQPRAAGADPRSCSTTASAMFGILGLGLARVAAVHAAGAPLRAARARREAVPADCMKTPELVAIGTSLGGLNALTALLEALPERFPVPIVVVQHRAIVARRRRPGPAAAGTRPPDRRRSGRQDAARGRHRLPRAGGLSPAGRGAGHAGAVDRRAGALGAPVDRRAVRDRRRRVRRGRCSACCSPAPARTAPRASPRVKARGGRAIVEDPATAECRTMPAAALAATAVDYVLPLSRDWRVSGDAGGRHARMTPAGRHPARRRPRGEPARARSDPRRSCVQPRAGRVGPRRPQGSAALRFRADPARRRHAGPRRLRDRRADPQPRAQPRRRRSSS